MALLADITTCQSLRRA